MRASGVSLTNILYMTPIPKSSIHKSLEARKACLDSVVLAIDIKKKKGFKPNPHPAVPTEMQRLQCIHESTKLQFDLEMKG
jgi:hypothetical protein